MARSIVSYIAALIAILILDGVWLGVVAFDFYRTQLAAIMAPEFNPVGAAAFYLLYPIGVVMFAAAPAAGDWRAAAKRGAAFGFFAYGTYDLTNWATLTGWSLQVTVVDMAWGSVISAVAAAAAARAGRGMGA